MLLAYFFTIDLHATLRLAHSMGNSAIFQIFKSFSQNYCKLKRWMPTEKKMTNANRRYSTDLLRTHFPFDGRSTSSTNFFDSQVLLQRASAICYVVGVAHGLVWFETRQGWLIQRSFSTHRPKLELLPLNKTVLKAISFAYVGILLKKNTFRWDDFSFNFPLHIDFGMICNNYCAYYWAENS